MMPGDRPVLIIDDHPDDIYLTREAILATRPSCPVEDVREGSRALARLRREPVPALVLLDLKLPGMDGCEILREIRSREETRYIPVVMLTSSDLHHDMKSSYGLGANGYISKEQDMDDFIHLMDVTLHFWLEHNLVPF
jgi:two-component system response regulator